MQDNSALGRAIEVVRDLRRRCPWDRAQTRETLRPYLVEEVLELDHALDQDDPALIREEMADFLLHLAWQFVIAEEQGEFTPGADRRRARGQDAAAASAPLRPRTGRILAAAQEAGGAPEHPRRTAPHPAVAAHGGAAPGTGRQHRLRLARYARARRPRCGRNWRRSRRNCPAAGAIRPRFRRAGRSGPSLRRADRRNRRPAVCGGEPGPQGPRAARRGAGPGQPEVQGAIRGSGTTGGGARTRPARRGAARPWMRSGTR